MKNMIIGVTSGIIATVSGMLIKQYIDERKANVKTLKEKARSYDAIECSNYLGCEEFNTVFDITYKFLKEHTESETVNYMNSLYGIREFFKSNGFIHEMLSFILQADISDDEKLKSIKSMITRCEDIIVAYKEYHERFLKHKKRNEHVEHVVDATAKPE